VHQSEVTVASQITEGGSLHLENKGAAGDDVSSTSPVVTAAVSTNPGMMHLRLISA